VALVQDPIEEQTGRASGEVVPQIINLPQRRALVRTGNDVYGIGTFDTPEAVSPSVFGQRRDVVVEQTRRRYCRPAAEVEREIEKRLGLSG